MIVPAAVPLGSASGQRAQWGGAARQLLGVGPVPLGPAQRPSRLDDDLLSRWFGGEQVFHLFQKAVQRERCGVDLVLPGGGHRGRAELGDLYAGGGQLGAQLDQLSVRVLLAFSILSSSG